uniref:Uncharacterized protein n=1 Tax=Lactuca sativa TaxID=4236 RepID=A0A9R1V660_LACSA|nr:hypothetical protein LSAT_V11C600325670 [Lactuca sativa]
MGKCLGTGYKVLAFPVTCNHKPRIKCVRHHPFSLPRFPDQQGHYPPPSFPIVAITIEAPQPLMASPSSIALVSAYCFPVTASHFELVTLPSFFSFPFAPSATKGSLLLLRSWSQPQRAVEFMWVITCRVGVCFLAQLVSVRVCLLTVGQKIVETTMAAAMVAITLLSQAYATKWVVGFPL